MNRLFTTATALAFVLGVTACASHPAPPPPADTATIAQCAAVYRLTGTMLRQSGFTEVATAERLDRLTASERMFTLTVVNMRMGEMIAAGIPNREAGIEADVDTAHQITDYVIGLQRRHRTGQLVAALTNTEPPPCNHSPNS